MVYGKQVLVNVLRKFSKQHAEKQELEKQSEVLRAALCAHCSTSGETMQKILRLGWISATNEEIEKQGVGLLDSNVLLADLVEELIDDENMPERIKAKFPNLSESDYVTGLEFVWWILSALQSWDEPQSGQEKGAAAEIEEQRLITGYKRWLKGYREDPW